MTGFPLIPFIHSAGDLYFLIYILARTSGLFLSAPLLSNMHLTPSARVGLMIFVTALLGMVLFPEYLGDNPRYALPDVGSGDSFTAMWLAIMIAKEMIVGYLIGFCFAILFEAVMLAGQMVGVMVGLSMAEMLDPVSGVSQSVIGQFFTILVSMLIIVLDLHHSFIEILRESFNIVPLGGYTMREEQAQLIISGTSRLYAYGLQYSAIPYVILFLVTVALGFMARIMPEMNIFMVGFPLKIFIGYYAIIAAISYFPIILQQAFQESINLAGRVLTTAAP